MLQLFLRMLEQSKYLPQKLAIVLCTILNNETIQWSTHVTSLIFSVVF